MEDFHKAGGLATLLREIRPLLHLDCLTVSGRTLGQELDLAVRLCNPGRRASAFRLRYTRRVQWRCCAAISRPTAR